MNMPQRVIDDLAPIAPQFAHGRFWAVMNCHSCDATASWSAQSMPRTDVVRKKCAAKGWNIGKRDHLP